MKAEHKPTEIGQLLIDGLMLSLESKVDRSLAYIWMEGNEEKQMEMILYIRDNENATRDQIMAEARRIAEK